MINVRIHSTVLALFTSVGLFAQSSTRGGLTAGDPVVERLDELLESVFVRHDPFTIDTAVLNIHGFEPLDTPTYTPAEYQARLTELDQNSPFALTYNTVVRSYIDLYARRKREQTSRMLGLSQLYFPVFEDALDRHGLPTELKYLAIVESALNPAARSRAGAVGLWQFISSTGKLYGLTVSSYVDERSDLYKSTDAACRYLKDLYGVFGDWELALAAYNCGPGNVNKAIRRSGGRKDYWEAYNFLPRETRGYVPAFIAVNYIMEHAAAHNIYPVAPRFCHYELDTVQVCYAVDLNDLARLTGTTTEVLQELNPTYRRGLVPDPDEPVTLYIPHDIIGPFLAREDSLRYAYLERQHRQLAEGEQRTETRESIHIVRRGESLGLIAARNGVTVGQLKSWNGLRGDRINPGQQLRLEKTETNEGPKAQVERTEPTNVPATEGSEEAPRIEYHVVQPGDTLWDIANMYPGVTVEDLRRLNSGLNSKRLRPGDRIKLRTTG
ncbi:MAG: LysM peptidoglycan-binding domain-containing protein [Flavobacteriales bacterium]|nr:LysM peptidoglycan-binding domain-containing protein [Flavobacteriales bacterium]